MWVAFPNAIIAGLPGPMPPAKTWPFHEQSTWKRASASISGPIEIGFGTFAMSTAATMVRPLSAFDRHARPGPAPEAGPKDPCLGCPRAPFPTCDPRESVHVERVVPHEGG